MNICICDDELAITDSLSNILKEVFNDSNVFTFNDIQSLNDNKDKIDVLFMDIKFKDETGIDFIKNNANKYHDTKVVYITGYHEYIEDVFDANPFYLLMKPITKEKILKVLNKLRDVNDTDKEYIFISLGGSKEKIKCNDIIYIESLGRKIKFNLKNGHTIECYNKLSNCLDMLPSYFLHIHKSYIVNFKEIKSYMTSKVILTNNQELPISRKKIKEVKNKLLDYI